MPKPPSAAWDSATAVRLLSTEKLDTLSPPWLAEALLVAQLWLTSGMVACLLQQVHLERGRAGHYLKLGFVLVVNGGATRGTSGHLWVLAITKAI